MSQSKIRFFFKVFESITDPLAIYDRNYRINLINSALGDLYQMSSGDAVGQHCYKVFQQRVSVCENCHVREVFLTGETRRREKVISLPDGRQRHFVIHCYPVRDDSGKIVQIGRAHV